MNVILDNISFEPDIALLMKRLHIAEETDDAGQLAHIAAEAQAVARPKAMYRIGYITGRSENSVTIDGVLFSSRILSVNLEQAHRVFIYLGTCGAELQAWASSIPDLWQRYWADAIQEMALRAATTALLAHIVDRHQLGTTSSMAPGSLGDWPLKEQRPLFELLGGPQTPIGVELMESLLMVPHKSVSGIRFPTEERFESCQLCPREGCPGRRAPYDDELYNRRYR